MRTPEEAYNHTLQALEYLKTEGVVVSSKENVSKKDKEFVLECATDPTRVSSNMWKSYSLQYNTLDQRSLIFDITANLRNLDIYFDTGGCSDHYNWELDWSFRYKSNKDLNKKALSWLHKELKNINHH